jgi:hypothetical protein
MSHLAHIDAESLASASTERLSEREVDALMAKVDVISRRLTPPRPAHAAGAKLEVLNEWPAVPFTRVAWLQQPGSKTFATAVVYEAEPSAPAPLNRATFGSKGIQMLMKRARDFGADAIVLHDAPEDGTQRMFEGP